MLEGLLADMLARLLRQYVRGIDRDGVKLGVWNGELELKDLEIVPEAVAILLESASIHVPVNVKYGRVKRLRVIVPWKSLTKQPVRFELDGVTVITGVSSQDFNQGSRKERESQFKKSILTTDDAIRAARWSAGEGQSATSAKPSSSAQTQGMPPDPPLWVLKLFDSVKVEVRDVTLRFVHTFEDRKESLLGLVSVKRIQVSKTDEKGNELVETLGLADAASSSATSLHKVVAIEELAIGLEPVPDERAHVLDTVTDSSIKRYVLSPLTSTLRFTWNRLDDPTVPRVRIGLCIDDVKLSLDEFQYSTLLRMSVLFVQFHKSMSTSPKDRWLLAIEKELPGFMKRRKAERFRSKEKRQTSQAVFKEYVNTRKTVVRAQVNGQEEPRNVVARLEALEETLPIVEIIDYRDYADREITKELKLQRAQEESWPKLWGFFSRMRPDRVMTPESPKPPLGAPSTVADEDGDFHRAEGTTAPSRSDNIRIPSANKLPPKLEALSLPVGQAFGPSRSLGTNTGIQPSSLNLDSARNKIGVDIGAEIQIGTSRTPVDLETLDEPVFIRLAFELARLRLELKTGFEHGCEPKPLSQLTCQQLKMCLDIKPRSSFLFDAVLGEIELLDLQKKKTIIYLRNALKFPSAHDRSTASPMKASEAGKSADTTVDAIDPELFFLEENVTDGDDQNPKSILKTSSSGQRRRSNSTDSRESPMRAGPKSVSSTASLRTSNYIASFQFENSTTENPLQPSVQTVILSVGGLEVVADGSDGCLVSSVQFWRPTTDIAPLSSLIRSATAARIEMLRNALNQQSVGQNRNLRLEIIVHVPRIVIPTLRTDGSPELVADLGTISLCTIPEMETNSYSAYDLNLSNLQMLWLERKEGFTHSRRILEPVSSQLTIGSLFHHPLDPLREASLSLEGKLGLLNLNMEEETWTSITCLAAEWSEFFADALVPSFLAGAPEFTAQRLKTVPPNVECRLLFEGLACTMKYRLSNEVISTHVKGLTVTLQRRDNRSLEIEASVQDVSLFDGTQNTLPLGRLLRIRRCESERDFAIRLLYKKTRLSNTCASVRVGHVSISLVQESLLSMINFYSGVLAAAGPHDRLRLRRLLSWGGLDHRPGVDGVMPSGKYPEANVVILDVDISVAVSGLSLAKFNARGLRFSVAPQQNVGGGPHRLRTTSEIDCLRFLNLTTPCEENSTVLHYERKSLEDRIWMDYDGGKLYVWGRLDGIRIVYLHSFASLLYSFFNRLYLELKTLKPSERQGSDNKSSMQTWLRDALEVDMSVQNFEVVLPRGASSESEAVRVFVGGSQILTLPCADYGLSLCAEAEMVVISVHYSGFEARHADVHSPTSDALVQCNKMRAILKAGAASKPGVDDTSRTPMWLLEFSSDEPILATLSEAEYTVLYFVLTENFAESSNISIMKGEKSTLSEAIVRDRACPTIFALRISFGLLESLVLSGERRFKGSEEVMLISTRDVTFTLDVQSGPNKLVVGAQFVLDAVIDPSSGCRVVVPNKSQGDDGVFMISYEKPRLQRSEITLSCPSISAFAQSGFFRKAMNLVLPGSEFFTWTYQRPVTPFKGRVLLVTTQDLRLVVENRDVEAMERLSIKAELSLSCVWDEKSRDKQLYVNLKRLRAGFEWVDTPDFRVLFHPTSVVLRLSVPVLGVKTCSIVAESIVTDITEDDLASFKLMSGEFRTLKTDPALDVTGGSMVGAVSQTSESEGMEISLKMDSIKMRMFLIGESRRNVPVLELTVNQFVSNLDQSRLIGLSLELSMKLYDEHAGYWCQFMDPCLLRTNIALGGCGSLGVTTEADKLLDITLTPEALKLLGRIMRAIRSNPVGGNLHKGSSIGQSPDPVKSGSWTQPGYIVRNETGKPIVIAFSRFDQPDPSRSIVEQGQEVELTPYGVGAHESNPFATDCREDGDTVGDVGFVVKLPEFEAVRLSPARVCAMIVRVSGKTSMKTRTDLWASDRKGYFFWQVSVRNGVHVGTLRSLLQISNSSGTPLDIAFKTDVRGNDCFSTVYPKTQHSVPYADLQLPLRIRPTVGDHRETAASFYHWSEQKIEFGSLIDCALKVEAHSRRKPNDTFLAIGAGRVQGGDVDLPRASCNADLESDHEGVQFLLVPRVVKGFVRGLPENENLVPLEVEIVSAQTIQNLLPSSIGFRIIERKVQAERSRELLRGFLHPLEVAYVRTDGVDFTRCFLSVCEIDPRILLEEELELFGQSVRMREGKGVIMFPCLFRGSTSADPHSGNRARRRESSNSAWKEGGNIGIRWEQKLSLVGARITLFADFWVRNRSNVDLRVRSVTFGENHITLVRARPPGTQADPPVYFLGNFVALQESTPGNASNGKQTWTNPIELTRASSVRTVHLPSASLTMESRPAEGLFRRSVLLVLRNEVWIENRTSRTLLWWISRSDTGGMIQAGGRSPIRWKTLQDKNPMVRISCQGSEWRWSRPVRLRSGGDSIANIYNNNEQQLYIIRISTQHLKGDSKLLILNRADRDHPPYRIRNNCSSSSIAFSQAGSERGTIPWLLQPSREMSYYWDNPEAPRRDRKLRVEHVGIQNGTSKMKASLDVNIDRVGFEGLVGPSLMMSIFVESVTKVVVFWDPQARKVVDGPTEARSLRRSSEVHPGTDREGTKKSDVLASGSALETHAEANDSEKVRKTDLERRRERTRSMPRIGTWSAPLSMKEDSASFRQQVRYKHTEQVADHDLFQKIPGPSPVEQRLSTKRSTLRRSFSLNTRKFLDANNDDHVRGFESGLAPAMFGFCTELDIHLVFKSIGVSIVDSTPEELVYINTTNVRGHVSISSSAKWRIAELVVGGIQVDNQRSRPRWPVMLAITPETGHRVAMGDVNRTIPSGALPSPAVRVFVQQPMKTVGRGVILVDNICVAVKPLTAAMDLETVTSLQQWSEQVASDLVQTEENEPLRTDDEVAMDAASGLASQNVRIYIADLSIAPIKITLSFTAGGNAESARGDPIIRSSVLQRTLLATIGNVERADIYLEALNMTQIFETSKALKALVNEFYLGEVQRQRLQLVVSNELLGNPSGLMDSIARGAQDFVSEPFRSSTGFVSGIQRGSSSLISNSVGAIFSSIGLIPRVVTGGLHEAIADRQFAGERQAILGRFGIARSPAEGIYRGAVSIAHGLASGVANVLVDPVQGALDDGAPGFLRGCYRGATGLILKPVIGVMDLIAEPAGGFYHIVADQVHVPQPRRPPRTFGSLRQSTLRYDFRDSLGADILNAVNHSGVASEEVLSDWVYLCSEQDEQEDLVAIWRSVRRFTRSPGSRFPDMFGLWNAGSKSRFAIVTTERFLLTTFGGGVLLECPVTSIVETRVGLVEHNTLLVGIEDKPQGTSSSNAIMWPRIECHSSQGLSRLNEMLQTTISYHRRGGMAAGVDLENRRMQPAVELSTFAAEMARIWDPDELEPLDENESVSENDAGDVELSSVHHKSLSGVLVMENARTERVTSRIRAVGRRQDVNRVIVFCTKELDGTIHTLFLPSGQNDKMSRQVYALATVYSYKAGKPSLDLRESQDAAAVELSTFAAEMARIWDPDELEPLDETESVSEHDAGDVELSSVHHESLSGVLVME
eukprot:CAMPEP_0184752698 /NCGR_PEP_ID=MMETSP0315-20130426/43715_1 /TAXON_ID=101924 /ORGANISM="Rhodosorus marinus, Strain UTEX LB 2760" /LENGTH=3576 /DNA_ID=CAMNT_0027232049 /DNA_START=304 /DNA_END=11037 /DNA_ORIENTATION=-